MVLAFCCPQVAKNDQLMHLKELLLSTKVIIIIKSVSSQMKRILPLTGVRSYRFCGDEMLLVHLPDALVQSAELSHQLSSSFVLVAAQVVHGLYGLRGRLQLVFIDVDSLVLGLNRCRMLKRV